MKKDSNRKTARFLTLLVGTALMSLSSCSGGNSQIEPASSSPLSESQSSLEETKSSSSLPSVQSSVASSKSESSSSEIPIGDPVPAKVIFDTGVEGISVEPVNTMTGELLKKPYPLRDGYMLRRWLKDGKEWDFSSPVLGDMTLTAEWLERTNLPTLSIELRDSANKVISIDSVNREEYVSSAISLMNAEGEFDQKDTASSFKGRGNGSWQDDKKGFKIKFDKKQSLFGRAANKHWVILACTNFSDGTMLRNFTAFNMAGQYFTNLEYTSNAVWLDLFVNGEYRGVYVLCEHIRVGKGRVDIKSEYGVEDTGYLIEYDGYAEGEENVDYFDITDSGQPSGSQSSKGGTSSHGGIVKYNFTPHSPDPEDYESDGGITKDEYKAQIAFIKDYVKQVYTTAITEKDFTKLSELADVNSLVDLYILNELYKNTDAGFSSFYMYKKPGGKLFFGPAWDFDGTTTAARSEENNPNGIYVGNTAKNYQQVFHSELFISLYETEAFRNVVKERWQQLTNGAKAYYDALFTEEFYETNRYALGKNFVRWSSSSQGGKGGGSTKKTQSQAESDWISDCKTLNKWFLDRITYLNGEWKVS